MRRLSRRIKAISNKNEKDEKGKEELFSLMNLLHPFDFTARQFNTYSSTGISNNPTTTDKKHTNIHSHTIENYPINQQRNYHAGINKETTENFNPHRKMKIMNKKKRPRNGRDFECSQSIYIQMCRDVFWFH